MASVRHGLVDRIRNWEKGLVGWQRAFIALLLLAAIGGGSISVWKQWQFSNRWARFDRPPADGQIRMILLPPVEGAHVLLPPGGIPAITDPEFTSVAEAGIDPEAPMILVSRNGETHAYSMNLLDGHEIVNDSFAGEPVATTW